MGKQLQFAHACVLSAITCGKLTKLVAMEKHFDPGMGCWGHVLAAVPPTNEGGLVCVQSKEKQCLETSTDFFPLADISGFGSGFPNPT